MRPPPCCQTNVDLDPSILRPDVEEPLRVLRVAGAADGLVNALAEDAERRGVTHGLMCFESPATERVGVSVMVAATRPPARLFDCIDFSGEVHDLKSLETQWATYGECLKADGVVFCRIAGALGNLGLQDVRDMLALLPAEAQTNDNLKALLESLPGTHRLLRGPVDQADLSAQDFVGTNPLGQTVREIVDWLESHGLALEAFLPRDRYDPAYLVANPSLAPLFTPLSVVEQCVAAELLAGDMVTHSFVARTSDPFHRPEPNVVDALTTRVKSQYESFPYPSRDPEDERHRLLLGTPSDLAEVNHYVFGGRRDLSKPFRALVAGGGTGDATVMLGQQLRDAGVNGEVVQVDISETSLEVARQRVQVRGLDNVRFVRGSLLDLKRLALGTFDYVDCCGVLHHLPDPLTGLRALVSVLAPDGGLGIMLYGTLGRTGVYHVQEILRLIAPPDVGDDVRLERTRMLLDALPESNWLRRNPFIRDHQASDTGRYDLLLHAIDRSYRVPEINALCSAAGLRIVSFLEPVQYDAAAFGVAPRLRRLLTEMGPIARAAFGELFTGRRRKHAFQAVLTENPVALPEPTDLDLIPILRDLDRKVVEGMPAGGQINVRAPDGTLVLPVPALSRAIMQRVDGRRRIGDIVREVCALRPDLDDDSVRRQFGLVYDTFNSVNRMLLSASPLYAASRK